MLTVLVIRSKQNVREYAETKSLVDDLRISGISALDVMTYLIPVAVLIMWLILMVLALERTPTPKVQHQPQVRRGSEDPTYITAASSMVSVPASPSIVASTPIGNVSFCSM